MDNSIRTLSNVSTSRSTLANCDGIACMSDIGNDFACMCRNWTHPNPVLTSEVGPWVQSRDGIQFLSTTGLNFAQQTASARMK